MVTNFKMKVYGLAPVLDRILAPTTGETCSKLSISAQEAMEKAILPAMRDLNSKVDLGNFTWREPGAIPKSMKIHDVREEKKRELESLRRWHEIPEQDLTPEQLRDMKALDMRGVLQPEEEIASIEWDSSKLPRNVHFGRVIEGPGEFYSARIPKKQRTSSILDDLFRKNHEALRQLAAAKDVIDTRVRKTSFKRNRRIGVPMRISKE
ncbi:Hypothetical protein GLP15_382 [Giardia lamblia P15]|uniref:Fcf2 pre-rRNA processing C-terminal domain-containing protein n=1 Tax=Giardia intestinalis (strain P15) TaxID=658858 RepID=E1EXS0_GIAIA|nr:Hypothetical protein GLP15_382 [Giardia lamblia P15]